MKVVFVKSGENKADMFMKNVSNDLYEKHKCNYIIKREDIETVGAVRCDNAKEQMTPLKDMCLANGVLVEYVAPYTPQMGKYKDNFQLI
jgi:hypothetical protein